MEKLPTPFRRTLFNLRRTKNDTSRSPGSSIGNGSSRFSFCNLAGSRYRAECLPGVIGLCDRCESSAEALARIARRSSSIDGSVESSESQDKQLASFSVRVLCCESNDGCH